MAIDLDTILDVADLQEKQRQQSAQILATAEQFGYGRILQEVACAWARKPPMKPKHMAMWLRDLADEIERER